MIPLRDENPSGSSPVVTRAIIAINCVTFVYELLLGPELRAFILQWGLVPERVLMAFRGEESLALPIATLATSTFLHGGWLHLIGNMWYLWIFGDNVEDRLGKMRFVVFYLITGMAAGVIHFLANPASSYPTVGASGAIAAVLGAYAITFPKARVVTLIPLFFFFQIVALPAFVVLILWFVFQFLSGLLSSAWAAGGRGGVAWWAHIGGFVVGAIAMKALAPPKRSQVWVES
jgi:membrane associated rhomboid family serine protease